MGETGRGDMALDTVRLVAGPCVLQPASAAPTSHIRGCSFNEDMCGYLVQNVPAVASSSYSSEMWSRVRGGTARLPPGHREDATNSGGQEE